MKTTIYIDGYNFYYSRLKGTPFKWLDIVVLFRDLIALPQCPQTDVVAVKFFTAPVKASYARHGARSEQAVSNKRLTGLAHWTRKHILDGELENAQLAASVPTRKKPAIKPAHWF